MHLEETVMSCGVKQIEGLSTKPRANLEGIARKLYSQHDNAAFIQWSDVFGRNKSGNKLYHYIKRKFPKSSIQRTKTAKNPNSGNRICIYTWRIPGNLKGWYKKNVLNDTRCCSKNKAENDWCSVHDCYPEECI